MNKDTYIQSFCGMQVAFNTGIENSIKKSFSKLIDIKIGIYKPKNAPTCAEKHSGKLAIRLSASDGILDHLCNIFFRAIPLKLLLKYNFETSKLVSIYKDAPVLAKAHKGYLIEFHRWFYNIINMIDKNPEYAEAIKNGLVIGGRSKGGAEAIIIGLGLHLHYNLNLGQTIICSVDGPKLGNNSFVKYAEKCVGKKHIFWIVYYNDIVPAVPWGYKVPGIKIQFGKRSKFPMSFKDHNFSCTNESAMFSLLEDEYICNRFD